MPFFARVSLNYFDLESQTTPKKRGKKIRPETKTFTAAFDRGKRQPVDAVISERAPCVLPQELALQIAIGRAYHVSRCGPLSK